MKIFRLMILATLLSFAACQNDESLLAVEDVVEGNPVENVISAMIEQCDATKTIKDENNRILWSENDEIIAFMKSSYGHKYQVQPSFVGQDYADFSLVLPEGDDLFAGVEWEHNVAYYPYSDAIECLKSGDHYELDIEIPSVQIYVPNGFGPMPMVAVSENNEMVFKNLLGAIKLSIKGTQVVKSIKLRDDDDNYISGSATVNAYANRPPVVALSSYYKPSSTITLDCGDGVQLSELEVTDFYIMLPENQFSDGFTITITDQNKQVFELEAKPTILLRSSILAMPVIVLDSVEGNISIENAKEELKVEMNSSSLELYVDDLYQLTAKVSSNDVSNTKVLWRSSKPYVASVDQNGFVKAISEGYTTVYAIVGNAISSCWVSVDESPVPTRDYIDEYGINHGKGVSVGGVVWAPVNCGYHETDYQWGKYYQWGRKYGSGYSGELYDVDGNVIGETSDATVGTYKSRAISPAEGNSESNSNIYYSDFFYSFLGKWMDPLDTSLWGFGTVKGEGDPCPDGWRVPYTQDLRNLCKHHSDWTINDKNQPGFWLSGTSTYSEKAPQVFLPASGYHRSGASPRTSLSRGEKAHYLSNYGCLSSNTFQGYPMYYALSLLIKDRYDIDVNSYSSLDEAASVRCVQE